HAQRLVGLARLREPNNDHVFLSHFDYSFRLNISDVRTLPRVDAKPMPSGMAPLPSRVRASPSESPGHRLGVSQEQSPQDPTGRRGAPNQVLVTDQRLGESHLSDRPDSIAGLESPPTACGGRSAAAPIVRPR